jgi:hypothetical protein
MFAKTSMLVCAVLATALSAAHADTESDAAHAAGAGGDGAYQLTLPPGRLVLDVAAEINLSTDLAGKPISLAPNLWYGATDDITVGLVHSSLGTTGFIGGVGSSLCLTGTSGNCSSIYPNVGLDVRYKLKPIAFAWAIDGGLFALNTDPFAIAVKLGVIGRWQSGPLAIEFAPNVLLGVTERDTGGIKEILDIPVTALYPVAPKLALALQTGFVLPIETIGDDYSIPLSVGAHYDVNDSLTVNLAFSFPRLIAGTAGGADFRSITLGGTYAF